MTHAEIAAAARVPYARRIAEDTRIIEILVAGLQEIADSTSAEHCTDSLRAIARRTIAAGLNEFLRESFRANK